MCSTVTCFIPTFRCAPRSYQTSLACADRAQLAIGSPAHVAVHRRSGIARANDLDVQVFRFTLGIPGFDDANIPRVIGTVGAGLLVLNHVLTAQPVPGTQVLLHTSLSESLPDSWCAKQSLETVVLLTGES